MPVNTNETVELTLPNQLSYLPVAQAVVREAARNCGFADATLSEIELGVEEAVTNIMKHAYDIEENPTFDIVCTRPPGGTSNHPAREGNPLRSQTHTPLQA